VVIAIIGNDCGVVLPALRLEAKARVFIASRTLPQMGLPLTCIRDANEILSDGITHATSEGCVS